jgi:hypothetical protein
MAVVAALAGTLNAWTAGSASAAPARPAAITRPAGLAGQHDEAAATSHLKFAGAAAGPVQLDAFLAVSAKSKTVKLTPRQIAIRLLPRFHWSRKQFAYLNKLWSRESSWNKHAENLYSGAYGIPQAVPGAKMATAGPHWRNSARTQILWGLKYIKARYGSPRAAWDHEVSTGWY